MNQRRTLGLLAAPVCWSAVLWIACGAPKGQPAPPSGLEVPDPDPAPTQHDEDLYDDSVNPEYPGAIEPAGVLPTASGSGGTGGGTSSGPTNPHLPNVPRVATMRGGSGGSDGTGGNGGASPLR